MARYGKTDQRLARLKPDKGPVAPEDTGVGRTLGLTSSPADGMTPASLITILREAKSGSIVEQSKLFEAMEDRDTVIAAHLQTRRAGVLSCGLQIVPDEEADDERMAQRAADLCAEVVGGIQARAHNPRRDEGMRMLDGWQDTLVNLLDAIGKGVAITEAVWERSESQWWIDHFERRPQRWFQLGSQGALGTTGDELRLRDATTEGQRLNPLNFVVHRHQAKAGMLGDSALLRHVSRPYVIKNYAVKDVLALGEIFGVPLRVGYYTDAMTNDQRDELWRALYRIGTDACALVPDGSRIEFPQIAAANVGNIYERTIEMADKWITLAILGQLLTSGGESGGSYALGQVHERVRFDLIDDDAGRLEETVRQQILAPLVQLNLGPDAPVPKAVIPRQPPKDIKAMGEAFAGLAGLGVRIPASWAHDQLGIPMPDDDAATLQPPAAGPLAGIAGGATPAGAGGAGAEGDDAIQPEAEEAGTAALLEMAGGITGMLDILKSLSAGEITRDSAVEMVKLFFRIDDAGARRLIQQGEAASNSLVTNAAGGGPKKKRPPRAGGGDLSRRYVG